MTKAQQRRFIRELCNNVRDDLLKTAVPKLPEEWDGHELRRLVADRFNQASMTLRPGRQYLQYAARLRAYLATCIELNLP